jgi:hypothetical protein
MTNNQFSIARDIKIYIEGYDAGIFTWGVSRWGGSDVWGTGGAYTWHDFACDVYRVDTQSGYNLQDGVLSRPEIGTATIQLRGSAVDPYNDGRLRPNVRIQIRAVINPDTAPTEEVLWTGKIFSTESTYDKDGNTFTVLNCVDVLQSMFTTKIDSWIETAGRSSYYLIDRFATAVETNSGVLSTDWDYSTSSGNFSYFDAFNDQYAQGVDILNPILDGEGGFLVIRRDGTPKFYVRNSVEASPSPRLKLTSSIPVAAYECAYSEIAISYDSLNTFNAVTAVLMSNSAIQATARNQDSIDLLGERSTYFSLPLLDQTNIDNFVADISLVSPGIGVSSITFPVVSRIGLINQYAIKQEVNEMIDVYFANGNITYNQASFVNMVSHSIDADNWLMTLNVWKGI